MPKAVTAEAHEGHEQRLLTHTKRSTADAPSQASSAHPRTTAPVEFAQKRMIPFETLWNAKDVAAYLKCSESWVYKEAEKGTLPCMRYGGLLRFEPDAIRLHGNRAAA
jgi:excisionase family DNA binding protein